MAASRHSEVWTHFNSKAYDRNQTDRFSYTDVTAARLCVFHGCTCSTHKH